MACAVLNQSLKRVKSHSCFCCCCCCCFLLNSIKKYFYCGRTFVRCCCCCYLGSCLLSCFVPSPSPPPFVHCWWISAHAACHVNEKKQRVEEEEARDKERRVKKHQLTFWLMCVLLLLPLTFLINLDTNKHTHTHADIITPQSMQQLCGSSNNNLSYLQFLSFSPSLLSPLTLFDFCCVFAWCAFLTHFSLYLFLCVLRCSYPKKNHHNIRSSYPRS